MPKPFFSRLKTYYGEVASVLRGEANAAGIFPNGSDVGSSRERIYADFLRQHAPSKCNVFYGGFLFGEDGSESSQLDVLVTTDTAPQFKLSSKDGSGKSFSPVEGTLAAVSIKSSLDKKELFDALRGLASIPENGSLKGRISPLLSVKNYEEWPYKVLYASDGLAGETIRNHLVDFYKENLHIPQHRRVNLVHVSGKYIIARADIGTKVWDPSKKSEELVAEGSYVLAHRDPDVQGIMLVLNELQKNANTSTHINFNYSYLLQAVYSSS